LPRPQLGPWRLQPGRLYELNQACLTKVTQNSRRFSGLDTAQHLHKAHYVLGFKNPLHPFAIEVGKRTFVQKRRVHHTAIREMVDYKVKEFDLIRVKSATAQEFSEGTFSGLSVKPH
jgi:hypothetical protein